MSLDADEEHSFLQMLRGRMRVSAAIIVSASQDQGLADRPGAPSRHVQVRHVHVWRSITKGHGCSRAPGQSTDLLTWIPDKYAKDRRL